MNTNLNHIFITGIGTEVGKTLVSAIVVKALKANYWKPIQAGDLDNSDTHKVQHFVNNPSTTYYKNAYALKNPMSPHGAAEKENIKIELNQIKRPNSTKPLVIEGAGGLLVPLNQTDTIADLLLPTDTIILVSRHYLGSINHTLLSLEYLLNKGYKKIGVIFSGDKHISTEQIILSKIPVKCIGRIEEEDTITAQTIEYYANKFRNNLLQL